MHLQLPPSISVPVILASTHGVSDINKDISKLKWYTLAIAPIPSIMVTPMFIAASVQHFSTDVGWTSSVLLHALWIFLAAQNCMHAAWITFTIYYVIIHSLPRILYWFLKDRNQAMFFLGCASIIACFCTGTIVVNDTMQKIGFAHILSDIQNLSLT